MYCFQNEAIIIILILPIYLQNLLFLSNWYRLKLYVSLSASRLFQCLLFAVCLRMILTMESGLQMEPVDCIELLIGLRGLIGTAILPVWEPVSQENYWQFREVCSNISMQQLNSYARYCQAITP